MSWFDRSAFGVSLIGACVFSASLAWAETSSDENIVMEKIIYTDDMLQARTPNGMSKIRSSNDAEVYSSGTRYFPVILISTADYKALDSAFVVRLFNEENFKDNNVYGSVRDYFIESSGGQFKPVFDIYPITLPKNFSNYSGDGSLIVPSLDILVERPDFKSRADKYERTIPFVILHPLSKEDALKVNDEFYNHKYSLMYKIDKVYSKNGYQFNDYAFVAQKADGKSKSTSSRDANKLGSFIHEFSHVIGLQDLYSNDEEGYATIGPLPFDVMALGLFNGNGGYPPTFSAFERESVGWLTPTEITDPDSVYVLQALSKMQAYAVSNPNQPNEYFLIEYRPAVGFDSKIGESYYSGKKGANGVLIWYIDFDAKAFASNNPNKDVNHQRAEVRTVLKKDQEYFADFKFVNKNGTANVEGIFNVVFDGNDRVCFTVKRSKTLDKCPDIALSSSSVASSSSETLSSSSVTSSSSSAISSSSAVFSSSSSLDGVGVLSHRLVPGMQMRVARGMLNVEVPMMGKKTLRFYDAIGNMVGMHSFVETSASVNISGVNRPAYVRLDLNGQLLLAKRVQSLP